MLELWLQQAPWLFIKRTKETTDEIVARKKDKDASLRLADKFVFQHYKALEEGLRRGAIMEGHALDAYVAMSSSLSHHRSLILSSVENMNNI